MKMKQETKKVAFCCPQHGVLSEMVEYVSVDMGTKKLVNIPVMYCKECTKYYTPFTNLLFFAKPLYKGHPIVASQGRVEKSIPRLEVRTPYFVDIEKAHEQSDTLVTKHREQKKNRNENENQNKHISQHSAPKMGLSVPIYLTNTHSVVNNICPFCCSVMSRESVNIPVININGDFYQYFTEMMRFCHKCHKAFITKKMVVRILSLNNGISTGQKSIKVENATIQWDENNKTYLFNPTSNNSWDVFYPDSDYEWFSSHDDVPDEMVLNPQSFLGRMGYSVNESEARRRRILEKCVAEYGKHKVLYQLRFNMDMRLKQKDGAIRYRHAIHVWRGDIWFVENKL